MLGGIFEKNKIKDKIKKIDKKTIHENFWKDKFLAQKSSVPLYAHINELLQESYLVTNNNFGEINSKTTIDDLFSIFGKDNVKVSDAQSCDGDRYRYYYIETEDIEFYINDKISPKDDRSTRAIRWLNGYVMQSKYNLFSEKIITKSICTSTWKCNRRSW